MAAEAQPPATSEPPRARDDGPPSARDRFVAVVGRLRADPANSLYRYPLRVAAGFVNLGLALLSMTALGHYGWMAAVPFAVAGLLMIASAARPLREREAGPGSAERAAPTAAERAAARGASRQPAPPSAATRLR